MLNWIVRNRTVWSFTVCNQMSYVSLIVSEPFECLQNI